MPVDQFGGYVTKMHEERDEAFESEYAVSRPHPSHHTNNILFFSITSPSAKNHKGLTMWQRSS